jgi:hypothetical protein
VKSHDGIYWMDQVYSHPMAPSAGNFSELVRQFGEVGLGLVPWVVPRGYAPAEEARAHAEAGHMAGGSVIVDFEYRYAGFFDRGFLGAWEAYKATLLQQGLAWVACAPDPRQPVRDYSLDSLNGFQAQLPQCYWPSFQSPWRVVLEAAWDKLAALGQSIEPILHIDDQSQNVADAAEWCEGMGAQAISLWIMGMADAANLDAFGAGAPAPPLPGPEPEPEPEPCDGYISALSYISGPVVGTLRKYKNATVKAAVAEIDRVAKQYGIS